MQSKVCTKCGETKETSSYYRKPSGKFGVMASCKECHKHRMAKVYENSSTRIRERVREYRKTPEGRSMKTTSAKGYRDRYREDIARRSRDKWSVATTEEKRVRNSYTAKRRAKKLKRTPVWSETKDILQFYINRPEGFHGDHEIPLQGDLVSGLHVIANLQYLTGPANMSKGNSFNPDDWYWVKE